MKKGKKLKYLIIASSMPILFLPVSFSISCSNQNNNSNLNQDLIDEQYELFYQSNIIEQKVYFQNVNFNEENKALLSIDEISKFISLPKLSSSFDYLFELSKNENEQTIIIVMKMKFKNSSNEIYNLNPSNEIFKTKLLKNVLNLTDENIQNINNLFNQWTSEENKNSFNVKNVLTNKTLDKTKYNTMLPSYLSNPNIELSFNGNYNNNENIIIEFYFNDVEGIITSKLSVYNPKTNLEFFINNHDEKNKITITGFETSTNRNEQITSIYSKLAKTVDLKSSSLLGNDKNIPFLSSGVNTVEDVKMLFQAISNNITNSNEIVNNILEVLNTIEDQWFNFNITRTANDINGILNIDWTIVDKFTGYLIRPENIVKVTTINGMLSLKLPIDEANSENKNYEYAQINNVYEVYKKLELLNLKQMKDFNSISETNINNQWLITNTNIDDIFSNNDFKNENDYVCFSNTSLNHKNEFRLKINESNANISKNEINGTISSSIILEIKLNGKFNGEEEETQQWMKVLPPSGISGSGDNLSFNSATNESFLKVGGFRTKLIENASKIYQYLSNTQNNKITIEINDVNFFNQLLDECLLNQKKLVEIINENIKIYLKNKFPDDEQIKKLIEELNISIDLSPIPVNYDQALNKITTESAPFKIVKFSSNSNEFFEVPFYNSDNEKQSFPLVSVEVSLIPSSN